MRNKILTVDDSKTVRIIVRKTFKSYDCEILEAGNGVEGLALAAKAMPDLILLDVTMPVMDGVEMLTKLKADPQLKGIPVMMLTAEGGRDHVLKIAKIGVRDYIVKPFEEDVLIEKAGRMIQEGLKHTPWKVVGAATQGEAIDFCSKTPPDVAMVSLTLPEESAFALFRLMRTNVKTKYTPVFGLVVKTETAILQQAQTVGFTTVITKPIDMSDLESRIAKAMNLDTSTRYFNVQEGFFMFKMPENCTPAALAEIATYLKPKLTEAVDAGLNRSIIDCSALKSLHMGVIKQLVAAMQLCKDTGVYLVFTLVRMRRNSAKADSSGRVRLTMATSGGVLEQKSMASPWVAAPTTFHGVCFRPSWICWMMAGLSSMTRMVAGSVRERALAGPSVRGFRSMMRPAFSMRTSSSKGFTM
jgi:two-component system cell cycle response regulator